jgi:hypothetical protein
MSGSPMAVATLRRLPGFAFEARTPPLEEVLPRMDVPVFVGIAASGPPHLPVPLEDAAQFAEVFGEDAPLALDARTGAIACAQLAPAVRAFFDNGGRRCWVIRVAGEAASNTLPVPGVIALTGRNERPLAPMSLVARAPGSWADRVSLSASLTSQRFAVYDWNADAREFDLIGSSAATLERGDLLRVRWPDAAVEGYVSVADVTARNIGLHGRRRVRLKVTAAASCWFDTVRMPAGLNGTATYRAGTVDATLVINLESPDLAASRRAADAVNLLVYCDPQDAPRSGEVMSATFGERETLFLTVRQVDVEYDDASPTRRAVRVRGVGRWRRADPLAITAIASPADPSFINAPTVERLTIDLWARIGEADARAVSLGLGAGHRRYIDDLPGDSTVFGSADWPDAAVWRDVVVQRFPAAGAGTALMAVPFGVTTLAEHYLPASVPDSPPLARDGLVPFGPELFVDRTLANARSTTLVNDAEYRRSFSEDPQTLRGLHGALAIEEATLIAVPDAALAGWTQGGPARADLTRFETAHPVRGDCKSREPDCVDDGRFDDCDALRCPPVLTADARDDGSVVLTWVSDHVGHFVVEAAHTAEFSDATVVYVGSANTVTIREAIVGTTYYRVRGEGVPPTEWSNGIAARVTTAGGWRMRTEREYQDDVLVAVHRLLLRLVAARRDLMAVLSLPEHYREDDAAAHVHLLASPTAAPLFVDRVPVEALSTGELEALGFAALYHGWLYVRDRRGALRTEVPDGAACGVIARRAYERGAWIAPANELLRGVVALVQPTSPARWQELQQLQINVVRQHPNGFAVMSADTLARDEDVRPINVRRLLILLRRLAILRGATYVFEPNDDVFRRMVQRGFEAILGDLFQRGAFAGSTAATAFQVVTGDSLNTRQSVELGRFIVELRVAPSRPLVFLTIRLVQSGERIAVSGA